MGKLKLYMKRRRTGPSGGTRINYAINVPLQMKKKLKPTSKQNMTPGSCCMIMKFLKNGEAANGSTCASKKLVLFKRKLKLIMEKMRTGLSGGTRIQNAIVITIILKKKQIRTTML